MKVYLVYPDVSSFHGLPYHPGLASLASVLLARGHEVRIGYFDKAADMQAVIEEIQSFRPGIVGFTAVESQFRYVRTLAVEIKKRHKCLIICGGPYVTLTPEVVLEEGSPLDAVIVGEGEHAMAELVEKLDKGQDISGINNLAYKHRESGALVMNPLNPPIEDLDALPYPNTELFPYQEVIDRENVATFHFNRGCPYRCGFCSNAALGQVYGMSSNRVRYRSVGNVMGEIEATLKKYRLRDDTVLCFHDDLLTFNKKWIMDFCALYKERIGRPFWCTARSNHLDDDVCAALKRAGCAVLMMGVESGNDYIRNEVMQRGISRQTLLRSFELCHKHGINTLATCIIGLPYETPEMIEDSIKTVSQLKSVAIYGINIFYPYKGTHLRRVCEENGYVPREIEDHFVERKKFALKLPNLSEETVLYYYKNWEKLILRHKGAKERLKFAMRRYWDVVRRTYAGKKMRHIINNTRIGSEFKKYVMKHVWNRTYASQ